MSRIYAFTLNSEDSEVDNALKDVSNSLGVNSRYYQMHTPYLEDMNSEIIRSLLDIADEVDDVVKSVTGQVYDYRKGEWVKK